jgi:hypothetical protein
LESLDLELAAVDAPDHVALDVPSDMINETFDGLSNDPKVLRGQVAALNSAGLDPATAAAPQTGPIENAAKFINPQPGAQP